MAFAPSDEQKDVIDHRTGPLAVVACPGSGKTETMSRRIVELVVEDKFPPSSIAAFTFTRKAAEEIKGRVRAVAAEHGIDIQEMFIGTIDSFCFSWLKQLRPEYIGLEMLDDLGRLAFIHHRYHDLDIGDLPQIPGHWGMGGMIRVFCNSVDIMIKEGKGDLSDTDPSKIGKFENSYRKYRWLLRWEGYVDFATVTEELISALSPGGGNDPRELGIRHLVVDECQDVDKQQKRLIGILASCTDSACVVGDDDQAIFDWRGSRTGRLDSLLETPDVIKLQTNYRSTAELVRNASMLIRHNQDRVEKDMSARRDLPDQFQQDDHIYNTFNGRKDECAFILKHITSIHNTTFKDRDGPRRLTYGDMAILVRSNSYGSRIAKYLRKNHIPVDLDGRSRVHTERVPKLAVKCIMHVMGRGDASNMVRLERLYRRVLPGAALDVFRDRMVEITGENIALGSKALKRVMYALGADLGHVPQAGMAGLGKLDKIVREYDLRRARNSRRPYDLDKFVKSVADYNPSERPSSGDAPDAVRIMTFWKAKGLEFPAVFIPSCEYREGRNETYVDEGMYNPDEYYTGEEDNRRLLYTAVTRSQKHLVLTDTTRMRHKFIGEMDVGSFSRSFEARPRSSKDPKRHRRTGPLTYDEVATYKKCPHAFALKYELGFKDPLDERSGYPTSTLAIVSQVNATARKNRRVPSEGDIARIVEKTFRMRLASATMERVMERKVIKMLINYAKKHADKILESTDSDVRLVHDFGGIPVSDTAGLLRVGPAATEITDFDMGSDTGDNHAVLLERVRFHAAAMPEPPGADIRSSICYIGGQWSPVDTGEDASKSTLAWMEEAVNGISENDFTAKPEASKCSGCEFKDMCEYSARGAGADGSGGAKRFRQTRLM